jgi:hypothetical protein
MNSDLIDGGQNFGVLTDEILTARREQGLIQGRNS